VRPEGGVPTTTRSKAAKPRAIPINPTLAARLREHKPWRMPTRKEWDAVMARAGVDSAEKISYTTRHDFLSRLANSGVPMQVVQ
jgi:integrase